MKNVESIINCLRWAYEKSPFYRRFYDEIGFSIDDYTDAKAITKLPLLAIEKFSTVPFFNLITLPLSAIAETCAIEYRDGNFIIARSAHETSASIKQIIDYLSYTGINRASVVALDEFSPIVNRELADSLSAINANILYLSEDLSFSAKIELIRYFGADTLIATRSAIDKYVRFLDNQSADTLFRVIMISSDFPKKNDTVTVNYEESLKTPVYEIISLPWTSSLIDLYKTDNGDFITRKTLLITRDNDGFVVTDTAAMTIPLINVKVKR